MSYRPISSGAYGGSYRDPDAVDRFTGSASDHMLSGALSEENRPDPALAVVYADDLTRALDTLHAYERGAVTRVTHTHRLAGPTWLQTLTDVLVVLVVGVILYGVVAKVFT
jgi:hypothetical protein